MELNDLDWADRETVLRLLFSKMNAGEPVNNWRDDQAPSRSRSRTTGVSNGAALNQAFREEDDDGQEDGDYGNEDYEYGNE